MVLKISTQARNDACDAIVDLLDDGDVIPSGYIEIRTAPRPETPQGAATGTILGVLQLSNPAFGSATNGVAIINEVTEDSNANATGVAAWFRFYDRNGNAIFDGDITTIGSGGDIEFDTTNVVVGGTISIESLSVGHPE